MKKDILLDISMFTLRAVTGYIFLSHGAQKLFGMFGGMGLEGTVTMVEGMGLGSPYFLAVVWGAVELVGGLFLLLGILARWAAAAVVLTILIRLWRVAVVYGVMSQDVGFEYYLLILGASVPIILLGGGKWSVWDI